VNFLFCFFTDQQKSRKEIHSFTNTGQRLLFFFLVKRALQTPYEKILLRCYLYIFPLLFVTIPMSQKDQTKSRSKFSRWQFQWDTFLWSKVDKIAKFKYNYL